MRRLILAGLFLLSMVPLLGEEIDFYKRVVRSVQRAEEELKALKKTRVRK